MKVLWFTNTPSLAETFINNKPMGGGWIKSLEKEIQTKVELSVVFYHYEEVAPFKFGATQYFPVKTKRSGKLAKLQTALFNLLESKEDIAVFLKIIEKVKPDVIHILGTENQFGLIQQYTNIPTVVSIQGIISVCAYKYFAGISHAEVLKHSKLSDFLLFKSFIHSYKSFVKAIPREKAIFKQTKNIIGRTAWDRRVSKVLAPNATYHHNDEILRDFFYKASWSYKPANTLHLFTTTGPYLYKGLETILYAACLLDKNNVKFTWKIAGISKNDSIIRLAGKKIKKPLSKNIEFMGRLDDEELLNQLLQSHMYITASHIENSPNNLCEAQILGVPCIATYAGGTASLMKDGEDGILIQDGDPYVMAGAIMELVIDYQKAIRYGQNAKKKAQERHNPAKIVEELLAIYQLISSDIKCETNSLLQLV